MAVVPVLRRSILRVAFSETDMARRNSRLTQTDKGFCRTIGHYVYGSKRVPRRFWLGHDRAVATRKLDALETAWEGLPGERGQKVWTEDAIHAALEPLTAPVALVPAGTSLVPVPPVAVPVFPPEPVPPPPPFRTYTLPDALHEFTKFLRTLQP
jgi:hypothetical protein